jgi:hypothetical protein
VQWGDGILVLTNNSTKLLIHIKTSSKQSTLSPTVTSSSPALPYDLGSLQLQDNEKNEKEIFKAYN